MGESAFGWQKQAQIWENEPTIFPVSNPNRQVPGRASAFRNAIHYVDLDKITARAHPNRK
jgi:hypothetical protein